MSRALFDRIKSGEVTITLRMDPVSPTHRTAQANPMSSLYSPANAFAPNYRGLRGIEARAIRKRIGGAT